MNSMVLQITLIIVMGNLALLLLKGMDIVMALYRTAMVSVAVLIVLVVASYIVSWTTADPTARPGYTRKLADVNEFDSEKPEE
ncbi:MAG: hypothetical protein V3R68_04530 [Gammaproteobacteria bacterium]